MKRIAALFWQHSGKWFSWRGLIRCQVSSHSDRGFSFDRAYIHTHTHTYTRRVKVIAISAPPYYVDSTDKNTPASFFKNHTSDTHSVNVDRHLYRRWWDEFLCVDGWWWGRISTTIRRPRLRQKWHVQVSFQQSSNSSRIAIAWCSGVYLSKIWGQGQSHQTIKLFQITPPVNDFQTFNNPGSCQPVGASKYQFYLLILTQSQNFFLDDVKLAVVRQQFSMKECGILGDPNILCPLLHTFMGVKTPNPQDLRHAAFTSKIKANCRRVSPVDRTIDGNIETWRSGNENLLMAVRSGWRAELHVGRSSTSWAAHAHCAAGHFRSRVDRWPGRNKRSVQ